MHIMIVSIKICTSSEEKSIILNKVNKITNILEELVDNFP